MSYPSAYNGQPQYGQPQYGQPQQGPAQGMYPPPSNTTEELIIGLIIVLVIVVVGYQAYKKYGPAASTLVGGGTLSASDVQAYVSGITSATSGDQVLQALSSGTGNSQIIFQLYPQTNYAGWNAEGQAVNPVNPTAADGSTNYINLENYTFFADFTNAAGLTVTDSDGSKKVIIATQAATAFNANTTSGGKIFYTQSFKVTPGTPLQITASATGIQDMNGFLLQARDCSDISQLLSVYPELATGTNGIMWQGSSTYSLTWRITSLNTTTFKANMLNKFNSCLSTTMSLGTNPTDQTYGLQYEAPYIDGTGASWPKIVANSSGNGVAVGRFVYDYQCNPVIDPKTGRQAYSIGSNGWGQDCQTAYNFCALDPSSLVGVTLSQFNITDQGIPNFVGTGDIPNGYASTAANLKPGQIGWRPGQPNYADISGTTTVTVDNTIPAVTASQQAALTAPVISSSFAAGVARFDATSHAYGNHAFDAPTRGLTRETAASTTPSGLQYATVMS